MRQPAIAIVSGTRPEIIKLAPVYHALRASDWAGVTWIHTGQHAGMAEDMFGSFHITPAVRLEREGQSIEQFSAACRERLAAVFAANHFDFCLVQGDTESAFLGALCAFYRRISVGHVEAGLRTGDLSRPFPEEALRQMISRLAALHFAPTGRARSALLAEGIPEGRILVTGNTVVDAQHWAAGRYGIKRKIKGRGHLLVTVHRREHWGSEMQDIFRAIADIAREHPDLDVLFPVHLNPIVQVCARATLAGIANVRLTPPMNYLRMQQAIADAWLVLTDSGGLQEEAPTYGIPVLVLRHETERPEAIAAGCAAIVGPAREAIVREVRRLLSDDLAYRRMRNIANPYGDGRASSRIVKELASAVGVVAMEPVGSTRTSEVAA